MTGGHLNTEATTGRPTARALRSLSLGQQFVASEIGKYLTDTRTTRSGAWRSPSVELVAATLTEGAGSGGGLVVPHYVPGITPGAIIVPTVAQLFTPGTVSTGVVVFMRETTYTNAAAPVAEAGTKPESTLTFEQVNEPLHKIAHWLPATDEILSDVSQMQSYIDARLRYGVLQALDRQILSGTGTPPEMRGLLVRTDLTPPVAATVGGSLDAIAAQISAVEIASGVRVDGIAMHPTDFGKLALVKDSTGQYLAGSPFAAPIAPVLWGKAVALSLDMPLGTALVGSFKAGGQLYQHGGVRVEASNSHADYFIKNLVAIRAEIGVVLALYRPSSFGKVTNLNAAA